VSVLADDPELTARSAFRERPLTRVIFDRSLRTPVAARLLSTPAAGPVIIVTGERGAGRADRRAPLEAAGVAVIVTDGTIQHALQRLGDMQIASLLLEGGSTLHGAAWDEDVVDFVRVYVSPRVLGRGVPLLPGRQFSTSALVERQVGVVGSDVMIEGYVHGPR
jgi:diaminohydroxyphosphoribosylaminopyrimidine deaminase/5-amino-6-(5-phosphoribosylamino)uracil reductase